MQGSVEELGQKLAEAMEQRNELLEACFAVMRVIECETAEQTAAYELMEAAVGKVIGAKP